MKKKLYLVSFYIRDLPFRSDWFHEFANTCDDWFHYTEGTYLLVSKENIESMTKTIRIALGVSSLFFILQLKKGIPYSGFLPKQAWKWVKKYL